MEREREAGISHLFPVLKVWVSAQRRLGTLRFVGKTNASRNVEQTAYAQRDEKCEAPVAPGVVSHSFEVQSPALTSLASQCHRITPSSDII